MSRFVDRQTAVEVQGAGKIDGRERSSAWCLPRYCISSTRTQMKRKFPSQSRSKIIGDNHSQSFAFASLRHACNIIGNSAAEQWLLT